MYNCLSTFHYKVNNTLVGRMSNFLQLLWWIKSVNSKYFNLAWSSLLFLPSLVSCPLSCYHTFSIFFTLLFTAYFFSMLFQTPFLAHFSKLYGGHEVLISSPRRLEFIQVHLDLGLQPLSYNLFAIRMGRCEQQPLTTKNGKWLPCSNTTVKGSCLFVHQLLLANKPLIVIKFE